MGRLKPVRTTSCAAASNSLFGDREVYLARFKGKMPTFDDDRWDLSCLSPQVNLGSKVLVFGAFPKSYKSDAKVFARALLQISPPGGGPLQSASSIVKNLYVIKQFFQWLEDQGISSLSLVNKQHLTKYRHLVLTARPGQYPKLRRALGLLYEYGGLTPDDSLKVDPSPVFALGTHAVASQENQTSRIPEPVLTSLVTWSLRWVDDFSEDVINAKQEYDRYRRQSPKRGNAAIGKQGADRMRSVLTRYQELGMSLPGVKGDSAVRVNIAHLARQANCTMDAAQRLMKDEIEVAASRLGVDADMPLSYCPVGKIDAEPWLKSIPFWSVPTLIEGLETACYVLIAFFSGMRDEEIKHLKRDSLLVEESPTGQPGRARVASRAFKGEVTGGVTADWIVGKPAARAVQVLTRLRDDDEFLLFPKRSFLRSSRPGGYQGVNTTRTANQTNTDLNKFVEWINEYCRARSRADIVPQVDGADWRLTSRQFRRTLAWFIARRPGGSIAGAIQFRHLQVQMFEGYAGTSRAGFRAEVESEEAIVRGEFLLSMLEQNDHSDHRGPSAPELNQRMGRLQSQFAGVVAESPRQLKGLLSHPDASIYSGELVTCVFDRSRALCMRGAQEATPDLGNCDPFACKNVSLSKENVNAWQRTLAEIDDLLSRSHFVAPYVRSRLEASREKIVSLVQPAGGA